MKGFILSMISLLCFFGVQAESVLIDGLQFEVLSESELTAQVVGNELTSDTLIDLVIPSTVDIHGIVYRVKKIYTNAFMKCDLIKSVSIPYCVDEISYRAFYDCKNLRKVIITNAWYLVFDYGCIDNCNVQTIILSGNVRASYNDFDRIYFVPQLVINGDIPDFFGFIPQVTIVKDDVNNLLGASLYSNHIYCMNNTPPLLSSISNNNAHTTVHVPRDAYAAYFQAPNWSSYINLINDAIETKEMTLSTHDKQLIAGEKYILTVEKDGAYPTIAFNAVRKNNSCVTIEQKSDTTYEVTGKAPGEETIIVACGELEDSCHFTVLASTQQEQTPTVTLSRSKVQVRPNGTTTISYTVENGESQEVDISCDNPDVAIARVIDRKIEILGVSTGVAKLTVTTKEGECIAGECTIIVYDPDFNGDDHVDISDLNIIINTLLGKTGLTAICDVNGDGIVDISDVCIIINEMLGKMGFDIPTGNQGGNTAPPYK